MYRDDGFQGVTARGVLRAILATAVMSVGAMSCAPGGLDDGWPDEPLDESPNTPPDQPGDEAPPAGEPEMPGDEQMYVPGQLLVRFKSGTEPAAAEVVHAQSQAQVLHGYRVPSSLYLVRLPEDASMEDALAAYREDPRVLYAQPNFQYRIKERFPDDLSPWDRWGLHSINYYAGADGDIDAPEAWDITTGSHDVVLGVIDTGIDEDDPDLAENLFQNPGEVAGNGVDDDGNGFVDDVHGINALLPGGDLDDLAGHGTIVSSIIGARGDNGVGTVGVMWETQIAPCKAFDYQGYGSDAAVLICMDYFLALKTRAENPVDIVATNNSWGNVLGAYQDSAGPGFSQALRDAIEAHDRAGILFVAAAGNGFNDNDMSPRYPASYEVDNVIAVAGSDAAGFIDYYSNAGRRSVDVGAPGDYWTSSTLAQGTSIAAAYVTGVIGLLKAQDPSLGPAALKNLILTGGDQAPPHAEYLPSTLSGRRLNAFHSLTCHDRVLVARTAPVTDYVTVSIGEPVTLGVLSIDCADPHPGHYFATVQQTGEVIELVDAAGTGHFKGSFRSYWQGWFTLELSTGDSIDVNVVMNYDPPRVVDFAYRDISTQGTELPVYDYGNTEFPAPFPIRFGDAYNGHDRVVVSPNGAISFTDYIGYPCQGCFPYNGSPLPDPWVHTLVAPFWMPLERGEASTVSYAVLGTAPSRELVIDWANVPPAWDRTSSDTASFQVVFFENSRQILFNYADVSFGQPSADNGAAAAVGVQVSPSTGRPFSYFSGSLRDEMSLRWSIGAPIALAGEDLMVEPGEDIILDAGQSRETVGAIVSYEWTQTAGTPVALSPLGWAEARSTAPQSAGTLTFEVAVTDEDGDTGTDTVDVLVNAHPWALIGDDVRLGSHLPARLDGSYSFDPDGAIIGYSWRQLSGTPVELMNAQTAIATFTAPDAPARLVFELTVRDEHGAENSEAIVFDIVHNQAPVAEAGAARVFRPGDVATLDGSASHDPDGTIVRYAWEVTMCMTMAGPCALNVHETNTATPWFVVPGAAGAVQLRLTVTDDAGATSSDHVVVLVHFQEPTAIIAPASCATAGATLVLDGSASVDADGAIVAHHWEQRAGAPAVIANPDAPVLEVQVPGSQEPLVFALTVTDDDGLSSTTERALPVHAPPAAVAVASRSLALPGQTVTLDGSASQGAAHHAWVQTSGTPVALSNADAAVASFVVPASGSLEVATFALTVTSACGTTAIDTASVVIAGR